MATSGVYTFNRNRDQIIIAALRLVGAVETGQPVAPEQIQDTAEALNILIKHLVMEVGALWAIVPLSLPLDLTSQSYTIGPTGVLVTVKPLDILEARRKDSDNNETMLTACNRDEYMNLSNKASIGVVNQYYYQPMLVNGILYVWPVSSSATDTIEISARIPFQDFVSMPNNADFPVEALRMLKWNLADEISLEFPCDSQKRTEIKEKALGFKNTFRFHDTDLSFNFAPERR